LRIYVLLTLLTYLLAIVDAKVRDYLKFSVIFSRWRDWGCHVVNQWMMLAGTFSPSNVEPSNSRQESTTADQP